MPAASNTFRKASRSLTTKAGCALRAGTNGSSTPTCSTVPGASNQQPPRAAGGAGDALPDAGAAVAAGVVERPLHGAAAVIHSPVERAFAAVVLAISAGQIAAVDRALQCQPVATAADLAPLLRERDVEREL